MTRPIVQDGFEVREMNDAEYAQCLIDQQENADSQLAQETAAAAQAAAKLSAQNKLAALGLTADEIAAL